MERDTLFDLLLQQGFRHFDTCGDKHRSLFEWRVEIIVIPHPSGIVYSPLELSLIEASLAQQTDGEVSIIPAPPKKPGDFADGDALGRND
jgi:hypothetical protein